MPDEFELESPTPRRVQLSRRRGARKPPNTRVVARPSKWGNPWRVGSTVTTEDGVEVEVDRELAVDLYRRYLPHAIAAPGSDLDVATLRGKNLACWCPLDEPCHVDVLLELVNGETA